jgi:hypothetical protein
VHQKTAPGVGKTSTYSVYKNDSSQSLSVAITGEGTSGSDVVNSVSVVAGDRVCIRWSGGAGLTTSEAYWVLEFEGSVARESVLLACGKNDTASTWYLPAHCAPAWEEATTVELASQTLMPVSGTIKSLYVCLQGDPGTNPDAYRFTLRKGGVSQLLTCTIVADDKTGNDTTHNIAVSEWDSVGIMIEALSTPGSSCRAAIGMVFVSTTDGQSIIGGSCSFSMDNAGVKDHFELAKGLISQGPAADPVIPIEYVDAMTLGNFHMKFSDGTSPGTGKTWQFRHQKNGPDTALSIDITGAATQGSDTTHTVDVVADDYSTVSLQGVNLPSRPAKWCYSFTEYISPLAPAPTVTLATPNSGNRGESTKTETIAGTNFTGATGVSFGTGITVNDFNVDTAIQITAHITIAWDATLGLRDVSVTTPSGTGTLTNGYTVNAPTPTVTLCAPNSGNRGQSLLDVTITGTGFVGATVVAYSGTGVTVDNFSVVDSTSITGHITIDWDATLSARNITVTTPGGPGTGNNLFTVNAPTPTISTVDPSSGNRGESAKSEVLTGTGFIGATVVSFGAGITVNSFVVDLSTQITANITIDWDAALGTRNVSVTTPGGTGTKTPGYTVNAPTPTVTLCTPNNGNRGQSMLGVTIAGTGFVGATVVSYSGTGVTVNDFSVVNSTSITGHITIDWDATLNARNITVTTPGGPGTGNNLFTVNAPAPTVTLATPDSAKRTETKNIVLAGTGFIGATVVSFGADITVNSFSVDSSIQITASITIAVGAALGARNVSVTTPGGTGTGTGIFTANEAPPTPPLGAYFAVQNIRRGFW